MSTGTADKLAETIDAAFERRDQIGPTTKGDVREAVDRHSTCSIAARHASRKKAPMAPGASING